MEVKGSYRINEQRGRLRGREEPFDSENELALKQNSSTVWSASHLGGGSTKTLMVNNKTIEQPIRGQ